MNQSLTLSSLTQLTLDVLWKEASVLGNIRVTPRTEGWGYQGRLKGYTVTLYCCSGKTNMEISAEGQNLEVALADAINEARRMGAGEL